MNIYKKGQGILTRWCGFGILALLGLQAAISLYASVIKAINIETASGFSAFLIKRYFDIPGTEIEVNSILLISIIFFALICLVLYKVIFNGKKSAEFLIETESELKKVSWPARREFLNSSFVVILSVVILGVFLVVADKLSMIALTFLGVY